MKVARVFLLLCILVFLGAFIGLSLSKLQSVEQGREVAVEDAIGEVVPTFPEVLEQETVAWSVPYPKGAIQDELVMHFTSRSDYLDYIQALADAGLAPLGQIDELLVVRIGRDAMSGPNPGAYGAEAGYSYRVERPLPPIEISPEQFARLQPFGTSAKEIVGASFAGDGAGILVGILDSGIGAYEQFDDVSINHVDLVGGGIGGPGSSHGTSVASIIAGSEGVAPAAELFVVRVLDDQGTGNSFHVAEGIVQATDLGVKVLNMSIGVYQDTQLLREAIRYAHDRGVVLVAAAGNDGYTNLPYPAAYSEVLSVTAVDGLGRQALFPNQSDHIDFAAPGVGILAPDEDEGSVLFSGTSAAAPFVTGTIAAMLSVDPSRNPQETVDVLRRMLNDAGAPGPDPVYGAGIVDWDRLRERDTTDVLDVALADIYLPSDAQPGTTMPVEVTVQNRGTSWLPTSTLTVVVGDGEPVDFSIGTLGPGQTSSRKVFTQVPSLNSTDTLAIAAQVVPEEIMDDVRLENNVKSVYFRPVE